MKSVYRASARRCFWLAVWCRVTGSPARARLYFGAARAFDRLADREVWR